jgi:hypothetical protein
MGKLAVILVILGRRKDFQGAFEERAESELLVVTERAYLFVTLNKRSSAMSEQPKSCAPKENKERTEARNIFP